MTQNEVQLFGFKEFFDQKYKTAYMGVVGGITIVLTNDGDGDWYMTFDGCTKDGGIRYYKFEEAQALLNNLERHSNGKK
jgi:hypothetical protein